MNRTRIGVGLGLLILAISSILFLTTPSLAALMAAALSLALWEWTRLCGIGDTLVRISYVTANMLVLVMLVWISDQDLLPLKLTAMIGACSWLGLAFWLRHFEFGRQQDALSTSLKLLAGSLICISTWCALVWLHQFSEAGPLWTLFALAIVWVTDSGAFFAGTRWGNRRLAPTISPNKSWEGFWGGLAAAVLLAISATPYLGLGWNQLWALILITVIASVMAVLGDLFESMMKRHSGHKDSGKLIPGHGGVLDRVDSILAALPVFVLCKIWVGI